MGKNAALEGSLRVQQERNHNLATLNAQIKDQLGSNGLVYQSQTKSTILDDFQEDERLSEWEKIRSGVPAKGRDRSPFLSPERSPTRAEVLNTGGGFPCCVTCFSFVGVVFLSFVLWLYSEHL